MRAAAAERKKELRERTREAAARAREEAKVLRKSGTGRVPGELLDVERVLATVEYWAISSVRQARSAWLDSLPPEVKAAVQDSPLLRPSTDWLEKLLPQVHAFLVRHRKHRLRFGEMATSISAPTQIFWSEMMLKPENRLTYPFKAFTQKAAANGLMSRHTYNVATCGLVVGAASAYSRSSTAFLQRMPVAENRDSNTAH